MLPPVGRIVTFPFGVFPPVGRSATFLFGTFPPVGRSATFLFGTFPPVGRIVTFPFGVFPPVGRSATFLFGTFPPVGRGPPRVVLSLTRGQGSPPVILRPIFNRILRQILFAAVIIIIIILLPIRRAADGHRAAGDAILSGADAVGSFLALLGEHNGHVRGNRDAAACAALARRATATDAGSHVTAISLDGSAIDEDITTTSLHSIGLLPTAADTGTAKAIAHSLDDSARDGDVATDAIRAATYSGSAGAGSHDFSAGDGDVAALG